MATTTENGLHVTAKLDTRYTGLKAVIVTVGDIEHHIWVRENTSLEEIEREFAETVSRAKPIVISLPPTASPEPGATPGGEKG